MRLFVAVELGDAVIEQVAELIRELRARAASMAPRARLTWASPDRLHLTLAFIGEADEPLAARIRASLTDPIPVRAFDLTVSGTGAFPPSGQPRVLWAGVERGRERLLALEQEVGDRLTALGIPRENRPYNPHLTLARVREAWGLRSAPLYEGLEDHRFGTAHIDAITLFQSRLSPKGPSYVPLLRTSLGASV